MAQWWIYAFRDKPWNTWFWAPIPALNTVGQGLSAQGWPGWRGTSPPTCYWFYKISPEGAHKQQLAIKSPVRHIPDRKEWELFEVKANVVYILTYLDDTPNWGNSSQLVGLSPPCGNWISKVYAAEDVTRSQTYGLDAAVEGTRSLKYRIRASIAFCGQLNPKIEATVQGSPEVLINHKVAVQGCSQRSGLIKTAVRGEIELGYRQVTAVSKEFEHSMSIDATVQGNTRRWYVQKGAVKGEAEKTVGISALVVKSRLHWIYLEFENFWPQEFDLRGIPNWPSKVKDWRRSRLR
jgi:hypothetical protein